MKWSPCPSGACQTQLTDAGELPVERATAQIAERRSLQESGLRDLGDRSGLLLISPPGYGKTTLMEHAADCLGMVFVRVNGPTLGHEVIAFAYMACQ